MNTNTQNVTRLLEQALADAVAGQMVGVTIALTDQDGSAWLYGEWEGRIALWFHEASQQFVGVRGARPMEYVR